MRPILLILIFSITLFSCKNSTDTKNGTSGDSSSSLIKKVKQVFVDKIYEAKGNGEKGRLVFIKDGNNMYEAKGNGEKGRLVFIRDGAKVYEARGEKKGRIVFLIEKEKYAYESKGNGEKGRLVFIKEGNKTYEAKGEKKGRLVFIAE